MVDNVIEFGRPQADKPAEAEEAPNYKTYRIVDVEGAEYTAEGYLAITASFVAVGLEGGHIVFVLPMGRLKVVEQLDEAPPF